MNEHRSRRTLLRLGGVITATGMAGCLFDNQATDDGHLFVENPTTDGTRVSLTVVENPAGDGERIVDAVYRVPADHVLEFDGVLRDGNVYSIEANLPGGGPHDSVEVTVETCEEDDAAERMDVRVRAAPDAVGIIPLGCDETYTRGEQPYVDPSEYRIDGETST